MAIIPRWQTPISRWEFEGNANDFYGLNNGTTSGTVEYSSDSKSKGLALTRDGGADYIDIGTFRPYSSYTSFTWSLWFKTSYSAANQALFGQYTLNSDYVKYMIYILADSTVAVFCDDATTIKWSGKTSSAYTDGNWHLVTLTDDNGTAKLYMDGKLTNVTGSYTRFTMASNKCHISYEDPSSPVKYFNGQIDDLRVYDVALTADEVMNLYKSYATPIWQQPLHHWKLDGNANDSAGNINGTASNMTYSAAQKVVGNYSGVFNGSNGYITADGLNINGYTNFSFGMWQNTDSGDNMLMTNGISGVNGYMVLLYNQGRATYQVYNSTANPIITLLGPYVTSGTWHHYFVTDANGSAILYVDGKEVANNSYTKSTTALGWFTLGSFRYNTYNPGRTDWFTNGYIDDVRFYDVALSASDVKALYNSYFTEKAVNFISSMI